MDEIKKNKDQLVFLEDPKIPIYKKDLLRSLSWLDFVPDAAIDQDDISAKDSILKIINYLTRHG